MTATDKIMLEKYYTIREKEKEITALRKCIVRIHEYMESAADSGMIPGWMFEEVTGIIEKAGEWE